MAVQDRVNFDACEYVQVRLAGRRSRSKTPISREAMTSVRTPRARISLNCRDGRSRHAKTNRPPTTRATSLRWTNISMAWRREVRSHSGISTDSPVTANDITSISNYYSLCLKIEGTYLQAVCRTACVSRKAVLFCCLPSVY